MSHIRYQACVSRSAEIDLKEDELGVVDEEELKQYDDYTEIINIALLGIDSTDSTSGRSDSIMVATLDPIHNKLKLTSFMRDSYVNISNYGYDKLNQLRHVEYFNKIESIDTHMQKQASLLKPKFEAVLNIFERELEPLGIAEWTKPLGGYFISFMAMENCAKAIVQKCKEAGTLLTTAGATYPYGQDPHDANIRIAPSFPKLEELKQATELFVLCVKLISVEKLLEKA